MTVSTTDPITLEVVRNKLDDIADEMEVTLLKSSHSAVVKEALDASAALFDVQAQQIAQATAAPIHLGMIIRGVERTIERFPPSKMREGDVFVLNDPFDGGTHLPDIIMTIPVIEGGETVALATAITHHHEIGGRSPGSTPMDATEIFQEGLRIPPMRLYDAGRRNEDLILLLERNVRTPEAVIGDLHGQLAACKVGRRGMLGLIARHGRGELKAMMDELLDRAEELTRHAIERIPDGTYRFADFLDNDGISLDRRPRIEVAVTVAGSDFIVDMSGTDDQVAGPINCVIASTLSAIYYAVRVATDPTIPNNSGCYRPVQAILPEGSLVNAQLPAAVNARAVVVRRTVDAILGALAQAIPERIPAASNGHPLVLSLGGREAVDQPRYVTADIGTGGMGARPGKDGIDAIQTDTSNAQNVPVEALEMEAPIRVGHYRLRRDSGGAGEFRGGLGLEKSLELLRGELIITHRGERHYTAPWGLRGGGAAASCRSVVHRADGTSEVVPSKANLELAPGDRLETWTTGGGGYGDPLERPPALVLDDTIDDKVSVEAAAELYGVVVVDGTVDMDATTRRREELRAERGAIAWTYDRGPLGRE